MALKVAMHNWMRPEPIETTITRLGRSGYDGIEISGEPAVYDADEVKGLLDAATASSAGAPVTLMTGGRDLVHEDYYVRLASVQYVKDCLSLVASLGGEILTVVPSTVGKVDADGARPRRSGAGASRASRSARRTPRRSACASASSRSTASRPTSSTAPTRPSRWPRTSAGTAASRSTSST